MRIAIPAAAENIEIGLRRYVEALKPELEALGVSLEEIEEGAGMPEDVDLYWDPYCAGGRCPQRLPGRGLAVPAVVSLHDAAPFAMDPVEHAGSLPEALSEQPELLSRLGDWEAERGRIDRWIVPCDATRQEAVECLGLPTERVDTAPWAACVREPARTGAAGDVGFLHVCSWRPSRNLETLVAAYEKLDAESRPPLTLVAPGCREAFGQVSGLRLITRTLEADELAAFYRDALALVHPVLHGSRTVTVAEAMAQGCPVLAADLPALRELCGAAAHYVPSRDSAALARAMEDLAASPQVRGRLSEAGRQRAALRTPAASARAHLAAFERAVAPWRRPVEKDSPSGGTCLLVLGMHRSGTSALTGALDALGVELGPELMPPGADNPRGYFEPAEIVRIHDELLAALGSGWDDPQALPEGWVDDPVVSPYRRRLSAVVRRDLARAPLWAMKDPRLCVLLPLWLPMLEELGVGVRVILVHREPREVCASLKERDGFADGKSRLLWARHVAAAERGTRHLPRVRIDYTELLQKPWPTLEAAGEHLGVQWPVPSPDRRGRVEATIEPGLRHRPADGHGVVEGGLDLAAEIYTSLRRVANDGDEGRLSDEFDRFAETLCSVQAGVRPQPRPAPGYPRWAERRERRRILERPHAADEIRRWGNRPTFHLAVPVLPGREPAAAATAAELLAQWYPEWTLEFLSDAEPPDLPDDPRIRWARAEGSGMEAVSSALADADADWVGLIEAGDRLTDDALFQVARRLRTADGVVMAYTDEDQVGADGTLSQPHFKPDFNPDLLRSLPYLGSFAVVRRDVFRDIGFDAGLPGVEEYDLALRVYERHGSHGFLHLPDVLYHRVPGSGHVDVEQERLVAAAAKAVTGHLERLGVDADVEAGPYPVTHRIRYPVKGRPLVSILIPTRNQLAYLQRVVETLLEKTAYEHYEVVIVDNGSDEPECVAYLNGLKAAETELGGKVRVLDHPGPFNYSRMMNRAAAESRGEYLLQLNNDTAILHPDWLEEMLGHAQRPGVGAVGARLLFPDGRIQHAGVVLGLGDGGPADHVYVRAPHDAPGYFGRAQLAQELSAVTAACMIVRKSLYEAVGGMDEDALKVLYNDVDLCLKIREAGERILWTPFATLLHEGSRSQREGVEHGATDAARLQRGLDEAMSMYDRWMPQIHDDPFHNRNLSLRGTDVQVEWGWPLVRDPDWRPVPRILAHPADREGCGEYRVIAPGRDLEAAGRAEVWETGELILAPPDIVRAGPDAIVLQRQHLDHQLEAISRYRRFSDALLVYELDDLLTRLPMRSVHRTQMSKDIGRRFREALAMCDRLVVATEPLAEAYGRFAPETVVMPNYLEASRWGGLRGRRRDAPRPRVGWAGGVGHAGDLMLVRSVVEQLADEVDWIFFGMCPKALRPFATELHPAVPLHSYPAALARLDLDLAIAPLEDIPFNHAKSNLRLLEYGAMGFPVVASDLTPYRCDLPVKRVGNRPRDWISAIRERLADRDALAAEGERLRERILAGWMLEDHLDDWMAAWLPGSKVAGHGAVRPSAGTSSAIELRQERRTIA